MFEAYDVIRDSTLHHMNEGWEEGIESGIPGYSLLKSLRLRGCWVFLVGFRV